MITAPEVAQLEISYATPERSQEFLTAALRGFYEEFDPEPFGPGLRVFEADRAFGHTVGGRWVSTCGAFSRTMTVPGGSVPVAAVTFVTVAPTYRRRGLLRQLMRHQLDDVIRRGTEPVALLWASEAPIYGRFGYGPATSRLRLSGSTRETAFRPGVDLGDGWVVEVDLEEWRPVAARLHERMLPERPGGLARPADWWSVTLNDHPTRRHGASAYRFALHVDASGEPDGYLAFRTKEAWDDGPGPGVEVHVAMLESSDAVGHARLWRFVLDLDLVRTFRADVAYDEPLRYLVADSSAVRSQLVDGTYVRLVDLPRALAARRYSAELDLVLDVTDPLLPANHGRFRMCADTAGCTVVPSSQQADLRLDVRDLGTLYLGGTSPDTLWRAGLLVEHTPGAVTALTAAFSWPRQPFCVDYF